MNDNIKSLTNILSFLEKLELNNNRDWFKANKSDYDEALKGFESIINYIVSEINLFDSDIIPGKAKDYIFRIYRDVRFSNNKDPYKNHFGAFISPGGRSGGMAGYYIHIERGHTMVGGGIYMPESNILNAIRKEVLFNHIEFSKIINDNSFVNTFGELADMKLIRPPKGFPSDHPAIELAKYKSYVCSKSYTDKDVLANDFLIDVIQSFKSMTQFCKFINDSIRLIHEE